MKEMESDWFYNQMLHHHQNHSLPSCMKSPTPRKSKRSQKCPIMTWKQTLIEKNNVVILEVKIKIFFGVELSFPVISYLNLVPTWCNLGLLWMHRIAQYGMLQINSYSSIGRFSEAGLPFVIFHARSCERSQRHFRADCWVGVASRCV